MMFTAVILRKREDGIEIENQFTPGSLAVAQECNVKRRFSSCWQPLLLAVVVTAVGENDRLVQGRV